MSTENKKLQLLQNIVDAQCEDAMWLQIFTIDDPEANIINAIRFSKQLRMLHEAIESGDIDTIISILEMVKNYTDDNKIKGDL